MGEPANKNHTSEYRVNEDGSVTRRKNDFIINDDGSVTRIQSSANVGRKPNITYRKTATDPKQYTKIPSSHVVKESSNFGVRAIVGIVYIVAVIIFFVMLYINAYEPGETFFDWMEIFFGLGVIAAMIWGFLINPILNKILD